MPTRKHRILFIGNSYTEGARAWSILASVMRTAEQQGRDVLDTLKTLLRAAWAGENIGLLTDVLPSRYVVTSGAGR